MKMTPKIVFNLVYWPLFAFWMVLYVFVSLKRLIPRAWQDYAAITLLFVHAFSFFVASQVCRALGVSQQSETVETFQRVGNLVSEAATKRVEYVIGGRAVRLFVIVGGFLATLIFGVVTVLWLINPADDKNMTGKAAGPFGLIFFGGIFLGCFIGLRKPYVLCDEQGVYSSAPTFSTRAMLPWNEIQIMEVVTKRNCQGEVHWMTAIFKNMTGQEQIRVSLLSVPEEMRDKFFQVVIENAGMQKQS